jgi:3-dehydro-L-gulonate 2-dehydrogenase
MLRLTFTEVQQKLEAVLVKLGMEPTRATACAKLFCETTQDGVYTHGLNRFPRLVKTIQNGCVDVNASPTRVSGFGALERWDGQKGPGNLNAQQAMEQALELSRAHGIGCIAMGNTNHWLRGGSYAWQAANAGSIGMCWTNTMQNLPPWGGLDPVCGNNPMAIGIPRQAGPVVLDMAMSQFSFGAIEKYRKAGEQLPVPGGFDPEGNITCDPAAIEQTMRPLPVGYWKGSGLSILLDMTAAMLSLGRATHQIPSDFLTESGLSQIFIAIHPATLGPTDECERIADAVVASIHGCKPEKEGRTVRYPGEQTLKLRAENQQLGLPVEEATWAAICAM